MSVTVRFRFPGGRFHATPWAHHVNEGVVEWPPSPWRILRALVAVWHRKLREDIAEAGLSSLLASLASELPHFKVPASTRSHTRHYMPLGKLKEGREETKLVFDTFVQLPPGAVVIARWPTVELSEASRRLLARLVENLPYLGRAESWVDASLIDETSDLDRIDGTWVSPAGEPMTSSDASVEVVRVLAPLPEGEIAERRAQLREEALAGCGKTHESEFDAACALGWGPRRDRVLDGGGSGNRPSEDSSREWKHSGTEFFRTLLEQPLGQAAKRRRRDRASVDELLPATVLKALEVQTGDLQRAGWSFVPGAHWVEYIRPKRVWATPKSRRRRKPSLLPTVARFELSSAVRPRLTEALRVGEVLRLALLSVSGRGGAEPPEVFLGRAEGAVLKGPHRHAHFLAESIDSKRRGRHGRITHITVYAPMGFNASARNALERVRRAWGWSGKASAKDHDLELLLLGVGQVADFTPQNANDLDGENGTSPLFMSSTDWCSRTPFVATRHEKSGLNRFGEPVGSSPDDVRRLVDLHLASVATSSKLATPPIPVTHTVLGSRPQRWLSFRTHRRGRSGGRGGHPPAGFHLTFTEPVAGPLVLGYGCHFGLGVFEPAAAAERRAGVPAR